MDLNPAQLFHKNGYYVGKFKHSTVFSELCAKLQDLAVNNLRSGYLWLEKEKYIGSKDLRPYCWEYDPVFLNIIFDQDILGLLIELFGYRPMLLGANIRINMPGQPYSTWHRDTSYYDHRIKGNVPPIINIHYYPKFSHTPEPQLELWPSTHHLMSPLKIIDRIMVKTIIPIQIQSDNQNFLIMDTSVIHRIKPTRYNEGAMRLMYAFGRNFQTDTHADHRGLHELFLNRIKK